MCEYCTRSANERLGGRERDTHVGLYVLPPSKDFPDWRQQLLHFTLLCSVCGFALNNFLTHHTLQWKLFSLFILFFFSSTKSKWSESLRIRISPQFQLTYKPITQKGHKFSQEIVPLMVHCWFGNVRCNFFCAWYCWLHVILVADLFYIMSSEIYMDK